MSQQGRAARHGKAVEPVEALLFDFGNVVVPIDFGRMFESWGRAAGVDAGVLLRRFSFDEAYCAYERNEIGLEAYFGHLRAVLGLDLSRESLLEGWNALFLDPDPAMERLLQELSGRYPLYLLSNTNPAHRAHWGPRYAAMLKPFRAVFTSCDIGARKPEAAAFGHAAREINAPPERIVFFDDLAENVAGARRAGLQAFVATGPEDVRRALP